MGLPPAGEVGAESQDFNTIVPRPDASRDAESGEAPTSDKSNLSATLARFSECDLKHKHKSKKEENVNDTIFAAIATSDPFQHTTLAVIVINALWIGVDTEWNHKALNEEDGSAPLEPASVVVENIFCVYFTVEVVVRFLAFRWKIHGRDDHGRPHGCYRDAWFVFDSCLVTCMVLETWVMAVVSIILGSSGGSSFLSNFSALRLLRLLRLTRMARLMRSVPELMTLVKGMVSAAKAVFFILMFLVLVMYVFAIIMVSIVGDPEANRVAEEDTCEHMFGTMGDAMMSLFTNGVLGDNLSQAVQGILNFPNGEGSGTGLFLMWLFMLFFAISSMTLLNMLIGVLCEVITQTAESEKGSTQIRDLTLSIEDAFDLIDTNLDGRVCEDEWSRIKHNPEVRSQFSHLGVVDSQMDDRLDEMQEVMFHGKHGNKKKERDDGFPMPQLIEKVIAMRPDLPASALELEILRAKVSIKDSQFNVHLINTEMHIQQMLGQRPTIAQISSGHATLRPGQASEANSLRDIPLEILFQEMKSRAQKATPGRGNSDLQLSRDAVSYSDMVNLCNDRGS